MGDLKNNVDVYQAGPKDLGAIEDLIRQELGREPNKKYISDCIATDVSMVAYMGDRLIGFLYCQEFSPDIIEIANLLISKNMQRLGVGARLVDSFEKAAIGKYNGVILLNSSLYDNDIDHFVSAAGFYLKCGYSLVAETRHTKIFYKELL